MAQNYQTECARNWNRDPGQRRIEKINPELQGDPGIRRKPNPHMERRKNATTKPENGRTLHEGIPRDCIERY